MGNKKTHKEMFSDIFKKTFDQRYDESTRGEKIAYWCCVSFVISMILFLRYF